MTKLPQGWRWVKLEDVCEHGTGTYDPTSEPNKSFIYIDISSVDNTKKCITKTKKVLGQDAPSRARKIILSDDVIVSTTRPNLNAVAIVGPELNKQVCSTGFCVLRAKDDILNNEYLFFWTQNQTFIESLSNLVKGALYPAVTDKQVFAQSIPLPPLDEQRRIVASLNEKMIAIERARAAAESQLKAAKALPAAYLREVFESREAKGWPKKRLGDVNRLLPAKSIALAGDTEVTTITTACLTEAGFNLDGLKPGRMWANDATECVVSKGEILIARSNTSELVGRVAMFDGVPAGVVASDLTIRVWPCKEKYHPEFLAFFLSSLYLNGYWRERAGGASQSMKKITRRMVSEVQIPTPNIETQKKIVAVMNEKINRAKQVKESLQSQLAAINKLPAAYLGQAFRGEL